MHSHKGIHPAQYQAFRLRLSKMRTAGSPARISADNQTSFFSARKEKEVPAHSNKSMQAPQLFFVQKIEVFVQKPKTFVQTSI